MRKRLWIVIFFLMLFYSLTILAGCQKASEQTSAVQDNATETSSGYGAPGYGKSAPGYDRSAPGYGTLGQGKTAPGYSAPEYEAPGYK